MAAPKTVVTYALNGTTREFDFSFDYLSRSFVQITLIGETRKQLVLGTDFTFVSNTRIRTNLIWGPPSWTLIEIRRVTSTTERLVDFQDASILRAADLNLSELQVLHVAEEAREAATETIGTNNDGNLDARGRRIINVADPVDPGDALNLGTYQGDINGAYQSKLDAQAARDKAKDWATKTGTVEGTLKSSKGYAEDSAASASASQASAQASSNSAASSASSATASQASASVATTKASEAGTYASNAQASAVSSASSMDTAQKWATNPEDSVVADGKYSAYHWSKKAQGWADAAATGVLPNNSVTASKLALDQKANMILDADFKDINAWFNGGAVTGFAVGAGTGIGSYLTGTINSTGAAGSFAGDVWSSWVPVRNMPAVYTQVSLWVDMVDGVYGGAIEVLLEFRDSANKSLGLSTVVPSTVFTGAAIQGNATVAVPATANQFRVRYRVTHGTGGTAKVKLYIQTPVVVPAPYKSTTDSLATQVASVNNLFKTFIGIPIPWPSDTVPDGYIPLDGRAVPAGCPILLQRYPSGVVPDMRDYFIRGKPSTGRAVLSLESDGNKAHTHQVSGTAGAAGQHTHTIDTYNSGGNVGNSGRVATAGVTAAAYTVGNISTAPNHTHTVSGTADSSGDAQARPKNIAFLYICMTDAAIPS